LLRQEAIDGFVFITPWLLGFVLWTAWPMLFSLGLVFTNWSVLTKPSFAGLANFSRLAQDRLFYIALGNTAYYTFVAVPLTLVTNLIVALALNLKLAGINIFRTVYYMPTIIPQVANVMLWMWIFNPEFGLANALLTRLGLPKLGWFWDPRWSKNAMIFMTLWGFGTGMIIFLAALQGVPQELYEVGQLDGANSLQLLWHVTIPMITPVVFFNLCMGIIGSFQIFTTAFIVSDGKGGPANSTLFLVLYLYRNGFEFFRMGYASLIAWVLFAIILLVTLIQFRLARRWVYYEQEVI
jgi:multiple sugar transport system permease protein